MNKTTTQNNNDCYNWIKSHTKKMTSKTDSSDGYDNELQATASRYFAPFGQFRLTHCIVLVDFQFPLSIISCLFCCISFGLMDVHCRYLQHSFTNNNSTFFLLIFICCFFLRTYFPNTPFYCLSVVGSSFTCALHWMGTHFTTGK